MAEFEYTNTNIIKQVSIGGVIYEIADEAVRTNLNELESRVGQIEGGGLTYKIVSSLPTNITENVIYLVPNDEAAAGTYIEYLALKVDNEIKLEQIGTTEVDLSDYQKKISSITIDSVAPTTKYLSVSTSDAEISVEKNIQIGTANITQAVDGGEVLQSVKNTPSAGEASDWSFTVANGILTINGGNGIAPTLPEFNKIAVAKCDDGITSVATYSAVVGNGNIVTGASVSTQPKASLSTSNSSATNSIKYIEDVDVGTKNATINLSK